MSELIQIVCINDMNSNSYDMEWGSFCENPLELHKVYWGKYSGASRKFKKSTYIVYETEKEDSLIGLFDAERFITLADWRDKQINSILEK